MKKLFLFIATIGMLLPQVGFAANEIGNFTSKDGVFYLLYDDGTAMVGNNRSIRSRKPIIIPETITDADGNDYTVTSIAEEAFMACAATVSVTIPNSVTSIGEKAFFSSKFTSITIPGSVTSIKRATFTQCSKLTSITIPEGVESIEREAFSLCEGLTSITIPSSVKSIGDKAFTFCNSITDIYNYGTTPQDIHYVFDDTSNMTLHVLKGYKEVYENASGWKDFATIKEIMTFDEIKAQALDTLDELLDGTGIDATGYEAAIAAATTEAEVNAVLAEAQAAVDLANAKIDAIAALNDLVDGADIDISDYIAAINAATTTDEVATIKADALAVHTLKKAQDAAIAELQAYANTNKIANVPIEKYAALINAETDVTAITDIVNDAKTEIDSYDRLTLGDWMYLMDEGKVLGNELALTDKDNYQSDYEVDIDELTYSRTFSSTNWQALYVPFSMTYDDWKDDMDVYDIYNVLAYDEDNDGVIERTTVNMIRLKEGAVTEPNYPYVMRAKNTGAVEITLTDATLYPAEENTIDCTSTKQKFTFTGTYHKMTGLKTKGCYALDGGILKTATDDAVTLNPQRWYMEVTNRNGSPAAATRVYLNPFGEEDEVEGVKGVAVNIIGEETTYDLNGRTVNTIGLPKGLYVRGGKKIIVK